MIHHEQFLPGHWCRCRCSCCTCTRACLCDVCALRAPLPPPPCQALVEAQRRWGGRSIVPHFLRPRQYDYHRAPTRREKQLLLASHHLPSPTPAAASTPAAPTLWGAVRAPGRQGTAGAVRTPLRPGVDSVDRSVDVRGDGPAAESHGAAAASAAATATPASAPPFATHTAAWDSGGSGRRDLSSAASTSALAPLQGALAPGAHLEGGHTYGWSAGVTGGGGGQRPSSDWDAGAAGSDSLHGLEGSGGLHGPEGSGGVHGPDCAICMCTVQLQPAEGRMLTPCG